jgi:hypothetical protein
MKRNEIIQKLIQEGFSEKTLVNFTDKQLNDLSSRVLSEQATGKGAVIMRKGSNPTDIKRVTDSGMNVELREKEEGGLNPVDTLKSDEISKIWNHIKGGEQPSRKEMKLDIFKYMKKNDCTLDSLKEKCLNESQLEINEWVSNLAETNYHSFTSKNEIMELIAMKLNESEQHQYGPGVTVGHNGIPEWFSSKAITANNPAPTIAPPKTKPSTKPKKINPYKPGPGPNPRPDAMMELGENNPAPTIAPPKTKPGKKPKKINPYKPGPGPNPRPDALVSEFKLPKRKDGNPFKRDFNPLLNPYEFEPMRRFNEPEPEKQKDKPKEKEKKEEKRREKTPPVPQEAAENKTAPTIAPPKTKPGTKPKKINPYKPGPGPNPRPDALVKESNLQKKK